MYILFNFFQIVCRQNGWILDDIVDESFETLTQHFAQQEADGICAIGMYQ